MMIHIKKNPKADLSKKSGLFLNIGLVISISLVIMAFEWKFYDDGSRVDLTARTVEFEKLLEIPQTVIPPPPPKIQHPKVIEVPDDTEIEVEIEALIDYGMSDDDANDITLYTPPPPEETTETDFFLVEEKPEPYGGMQTFYRYISKNLKYPAKARRIGIGGKVFVTFVVDKDGWLTEVNAVKGIGAGCDGEAVRVIQNAPKWKPGKQRGKPVKVRMTLPITFKLE
jgi:protein TonB